MMKLFKQTQDRVWSCAGQGIEVPQIVIPAKAGICQEESRETLEGIPAFAGMTEELMQRVMITAAASGIGRHIAKAFSRGRGPCTHLRCQRGSA